MAKKDTRIELKAEDVKKMLAALSLRQLHVLYAISLINLEKKRVGRKDGAKEAEIEMVISDLKKEKVARKFIERRCLIVMAGVLK